MVKWYDDRSVKFVVGWLNIGSVVITYMYNNQMEIGDFGVSLN